MTNTEIKLHCWGTCCFPFLPFQVSHDHAFMVSIYPSAFNFIVRWQCHQWTTRYLRASFGARSSKLSSLIMDISWKVWAYFSCVRSFHQSISWDWFQVSRGEFSAFCLESSLWPDFGWGPADERRVSKIFPLMPDFQPITFFDYFRSFSLGFLGLFISALSRENSFKFEN